MHLWANLPGVEGEEEWNKSTGSAQEEELDEAAVNKTGGRDNTHEVVMKMKYEV
jgi:hypothetical protein